MLDRSAVVTCDADLEAVVGGRPMASMLKSIGFLDEHCRTLLAHAPFLVVGTQTGAGSLQAFTVGGPAGFAAPVDDAVLPLGPLDGRDVCDGTPVGVIALVPGYGETLRVNGRLRVDGSSDLVGVDVDEAFLHCAKAIIRSRLWADADGADDADDATPASFLAAAPFALLATIDDGGNADVSPKGDPAGLIRLLDERTIAIADRPGNKRTDTLHNLMTRPELALLALCPGAGDVVEVRGTATVSTDPDLLDTMRLRDRTPDVAIVVDIEHQELREEPSIAAAHLWDHDRQVDKGTLPRAATIWTDHMRITLEPDYGAEKARELVDEQALADGVAHDYQTNL